MSKAIEENKLTVTIKRSFILEIYVNRQKLWSEQNELTPSPLPHQLQLT